MREQGEKGWTDDAALWSTWIQGESGRWLVGMVAHTVVLWSASEVDQNP